jgi:hypothetical protein
MASHRKKFGATIRALREKKKLTDPQGCCKVSGSLGC